MANILTTKPIQIDTAGATSAITEPQWVNSIIVIASADTWSVVLHDSSAGANVVFRADSNIVNHRSVAWSPAKTQRFSGIYATTMTDIALVLIFVD